MPAIFLVLLWGLLAVDLAYSAVDTSKLTETQLKAIAERELNMVPASGSLSPFAAPDSGLVSTAEALRREVREPKNTSEFELGLQNFRPAGYGRISPTETYSYDSLSAKPMLLLGGRHWFIRRLAGPFPWRAGAGMEAGIASHELTIRTSRGTVHENVRLNHLLILAGPELELFFGPALRWAAGVKAMAGRAAATQASSLPSLDGTQDAGIWEGEAHIRFQPGQNFFARLAYARRGILGSSEGLGIQENNYAALIGFGM